MGDKQNLIIAVDFDGTLCENKYPLAGAPNWPLIAFLRLARSSGAKLILWTCRTKSELDFAIKWCEEHDLKFDAVNENVQEAIDKFGGDSRKIYADFYIDDKNVNPKEWLIPFKLSNLEI